MLERKKSNSMWGKKQRKLMDLICFETSPVQMAMNGVERTEYVYSWNEVEIWIRRVK